MLLLGALYLLHTTGELCLSPVGIAQITKLSIPKVVSFMMAVWFLSSSIAQLVGARIAAMAGSETVGGQVMDSHAALVSSLAIFQKLGWAGIAAGVVFIGLSPLIGKWTHGADEGDPHVPPPVDAERQALASGEP
jgi:POT family proton-dependent oligopeptide transporter